MKKLVSGIVTSALLLTSTVLPIGNFQVSAEVGGAGSLFINEIMAANTLTLRDGDLEDTKNGSLGGSYSDWIEIYNGSAQAVDLTGYTISDDSATWTIPQGTIPAKGYLLVWASDKNKVASDGQLHSNFKLSSAGETITLKKADGTAVDSVKYGALTDDTSYARKTDGAAELIISSKATPGSTNQTLVPTATPTLAPSRSIFINEVMTANTATLRDGDVEDAKNGSLGGSYSDWIEIYNGNTQAVDLTGYTLTDDSGTWVFPKGTVPAKGYLMVWASGKDKIAKDGQLHTNFKLSASGEKVTLGKSDGTVVDYINCISLADDQSYGSKTEGKTDYVIFSQSTPGTTNKNGTILAQATMTPTPLPSDTITATPTNTKTPSAYLYGDVNGDGTVDSADYTYLRRYLLDIITELPSKDWRITADLNKDGTVDSADYTMLRRYLLDIITLDDSIYPKNIEATGSALLDYVTSGATVSEGVDALTVKDNNGNVVNMKYSSSKFNHVNYYIYYTSSNNNVVSVGDGDGTYGIAYGNNDIKYSAGSTVGTATLTYKLVSDNDFNVNNGFKVIDTYTQTVHNIAIGDVSDYKLMGDATIWAVDPTRSRANLGQINLANTAPNAQISETKQEFMVHGYNSSGKEVAIPDSIVIYISVSDQTNFKVIGYTSGSKTANVYALRADDDAKALVTAIIIADGKTKTACAEIKSSKKAPITDSMSVGQNDPLSDGTGNVFKDVGNGIYEVTATNLKTYMNGKSFAKFDALGNSTGSHICVEVKDQYGKAPLVPEYILAVAKFADGTTQKTIDSKTVSIESKISYDSSKNVLTIADDITNAAYDGAIITVTSTSGGKSLDFSIRINNSLN